MDKPSTTSEKVPTDERDLVLSMRKLDLIKELGEKQTQYQRLQEHLHQTGDLVSRESQVLREFRKELEMLVQERMSHIEELRLIHADINIMETTIKQAEEERQRALQDSKRLLKDYQPMKEQINKLRDMLNLEKLPDNDEDETLAVTMQLISQQATDQDLLPNRSGHPSTIGLDTAHEPYPLGLSFPHSSQSMNSSAASSSMSSFVNHAQQSSTVSMPKMLGNGMTSTLDRSNFRQQPPPMKTCQSCQQQIHRNAPICPICKAKSRSRNPKKPKRRHTDVQP